MRQDRLDELFSYAGLAAGLIIMAVVVWTMIMLAVIVTKYAFAM